MGRRTGPRVHTVGALCVVTVYVCVWCGRYIVHCEWSRYTCVCGVVGILCTVCGHGIRVRVVW